MAIDINDEQEYFYRETGLLLNVKQIEEEFGCKNYDLTVFSHYSDGEGNYEVLDKKEASELELRNEVNCLIYYATNKSWMNQQKGHGLEELQ